MPDDDVVIIHGVTRNGASLRPSDWIDRLCSTLASFGLDHRLCYDRGIHPCMIEGERCLVVARGLSSSDPAAFNFIMEFARSNDLKVQEDRRYDERALEPQ